MKIETSKAALTRNLRTIDLCTKAGTNLVDIEAGAGVDNYLNLSAYNSVISVAVQDVPSKLLSAGNVVVDAVKLKQIVDLCSSDDPIKLEREGSELVVKSGPTLWRIPNRYSPTLMEPALIESLLPYDTVKFVEALKIVSAAASKTQENLKIVQIKNAKMRASGEGRVHQMELEGFPFDCEIPSGVVPQVVSFLESYKAETFAIGQSDIDIVFYISGRATLHVKKSAYKFADVENALLRPAFSNNRHLEIDLDNLTRAIKRVRVSANATNAVQFVLSNDSIEVRARDEAGNFAAEKLACLWRYDAATVTVNHKYFLDALTDMSPTCRLMLAEDTKTTHSSILLNDTVTGQVAVVPQMNAEMFKL